MNDLQRQQVETALHLLTSKYITGNRCKLGTVGELDLITAIQQLRKALTYTPVSRRLKASDAPVIEGL